MSPKLKVALLSIGLLIGGCLDQIDLGQNITNQENLIIDARLVHGDVTNIRVQITRLFNFQPGQVSPLIVNSVQVINEDGQSLSLPPIDIGVYGVEIVSNNSQFPIAIGSSYHVVVETMDGRIFKSDSDRLLGTPEGELVVNLVNKPLLKEVGAPEDVPHVCFSINMPIRTEADSLLSRFRFRFDRIYKLTDNKDQQCYFIQPFHVADLVVFDPNNLDGPDEVLIPLVDETVAHYFSEGYNFVMYQESVSKVTADYFKNVQALLVRTGNMFEPPVGKLTGNFQSEDGSEEVFGIFYASTERIYRRYISPDFANNPLPHCPSPEVGFQNRDCEDCLFYNSNTQLEQPAFWVE